MVLKCREWWNTHNPYREESGTASVSNLPLVQEHAAASPIHAVEPPRGSWVDRGGSRPDGGGAQAAFMSAGHPIPPPHTCTLCTGGEPQDVFPAGISLNLSGWQTIPNVCAYPREAMPRDWMFDENECTTPPALVIEVLSPQQNLQPLLEKVREYLRHGVSACWVVIPGTESISVYPQSGPSQTVAEGVVRHDALDVEVNLSEVFS